MFNWIATSGDKDGGRTGGWTDKGGGGEVYDRAGVEKTYTLDVKVISRG